MNPTIQPNPHINILLAEEIEDLFIEANEIPRRIIDDNLDEDEILTALFEAELDRRR